MRLLKNDDTSQKLHHLVFSRAKTGEHQNSKAEFFRYDLTFDKVKTASFLLHLSYSKVTDV